MDELPGDTWRRGCPRAVTFAQGGGWVLYGKTWFEWSETGLPLSLVDALETGRQEDWTINVGTQRFTKLGFVKFR